MKKLTAATFFLLVLSFTACSSFVGSTPAVAPTAAFTPLPGLTPALALTHAALPPDAVSALVPEGQSASKWNGIPIMPGAIAGEGDEESYVFTIEASAKQVQEYYELELDRLGWQPFAQGDGDSEVMFMNNEGSTITISIISKGDRSLVLLVK